MARECSLHAGHAVLPDAPGAERLLCALAVIAVQLRLVQRANFADQGPQHHWWFSTFRAQSVQHPQAGAGIALQGDASASLRMLHGLRAEGAEPPVVLWALVREIRTLYEAQLDCDNGKSAQQALSARRVWQNRMACMQAALARHDANSLSLLLEQAAQVDGSIKGFAGGKPWDNLARLVLGLCKIPC